MKIREAVLGDYAELMDFYTYMCTVLDGKDFLPHGNKGGFPSAEMVSDAIKDQNLFVLNHSLFVVTEQDLSVLIHLRGNNGNVVSFAE